MFVLVWRILAYNDNHLNKVPSRFWLNLEFGNLGGQSPWVYDKFDVCVKPILRERLHDLDILHGMQAMAQTDRQTHGHHDL